MSLFGDPANNSSRKPRRASIKAKELIREVTKDMKLRTMKEDDDLRDPLDDDSPEELSSSVEVIEVEMEEDVSEVEDLQEEEDPKQVPRKRKSEAGKKRIRAPRPRVKCDICLKTFDIYHIKTHKANKHGSSKPSNPLLTGIKKGSDDNPYKCPMKDCNARLKTPQFLKRHFLLHLETNPFACRIPGCGVKCDAQSHLDRHMRQHTGELQVKCKICGLALSRKDKLVTHKCSEFKKSGDKNQSYINRYAHLRLERVPKSKVNKLAVVAIPQAKPRARRLDLNPIFLRDPVFIKVSKKNPEFRKLILGQGVGGSRSKSGKEQTSESSTSNSNKMKVIYSSDSSDSEDDEMEADTDKLSQVSLVSTHVSNITTTNIKVERELIIEADHDRHDANDNDKTDSSFSHDIVVKTEVDIS